MAKLRFDKKWKPATKPAIRGHPRSGNHFLGASVALNFYSGREDFGFLMRRRLHRFPEGENWDPRIKVLYIWRPFDDVVNSIWGLRKALSIVEQNKYAFLSQAYCDSIDSSLEYSKTPVAKFVPEGVLKMRYTRHFAHVDQTPYEYWRSHCEAWREAAKQHPNTLLVSYDKLNEDFDNQMLQIARHLQSSRTEFERPPRVGMVRCDYT